MFTRYKRGAFFLLLVVGLFSGCLKPPPVQQEELIAWPSLPDEPRVIYVSTHRGNQDFVKPTFFDLLFGTMPIVKPDLLKPYGLAASGGVIYVADSVLGYVVAIDPRLEKVSYIGASGKAKLKQPFGIAVTPDGLLYVADAGLKSIMVYRTNGEVVAAIGSKGDLMRPAGLAVNYSLGRLYVVDSQRSAVYAYSLKGDFLFEFKRGTEGDAGYFNGPTNIAVDNNTGQVYVVDTNTFRVQVFDKDGVYLRKFGQLGDGPGDFSRPKGISVDSEGHVYVVDAAFNNIQIFSPEGKVLLAFGSYGSSKGSFILPAGLHIDEKDRIYVVDHVNKQVQVFQYVSDTWKKENPVQYKKYLLPE
jgi:DNA-binding beta-propeller fold protein YncE